MDVLRAPSTAHPGTQAPAAPRECPVCGSSLAGSRDDATYCSGRCRVAASRDRRRLALEARLAAAERALADAAAAVAALRAAVLG